MPEETADNGSNGQNMVSNLPLLFAAGYPTSLEKITEKQLEKFVPFMVQCSCGNISGIGTDETKPGWWPDDLQFMKPFRRPDDFHGDWHAKLKELVVFCYSYHKSIFLLRFCQQLSLYEQASLRFINNYNSTTSLFHRTTNKLLVTFRNENMMYDQPTTQRKSLLPKSPSASNLETQQQQQMVETSLFDIYLCDNCDAELYSLCAYTEHEKTCLANSGDGDEDDDDDDVILIDGDDCMPAGKNDKEDFLSMVGLRHINAPPVVVANRRRINNNYTDLMSPEKQLRRLPNRSRAAAALTKNPTIPISSPCGQLLLKHAKNVMTREYQTERLERLERFCGAPPINGGDVPRFMRNRPQPAAINVTFRKPDDDCHYHTYKFPRRQLSTKRKQGDSNQVNSFILKSFRPFSVKVKRLSSTDIELQKAKLRQAAQRPSTTLAPAKRVNVVEFIDLCSSDEEDGVMNVDDDDDVIQTIIPDRIVDEDVTNLSGGSAISSEVDENQLRKVDGTVISVPVTPPSFPVAQFSNSAIQPLRTSVAQQLNNNNNAAVQPLRPVFLFSNKYNGDNYQPTHDTSTASEKATSIKDWVNTQPTARKSTAAPVRKMPALVNIQQYTTTTIRTTTISAANVVT